MTSKSKPKSGAKSKPKPSPKPSPKSKSKSNSVANSVELATMPFEQTKDWESWLDANHQSVKGIWLKFAKKDSGTPSITYAEALDVALCYGWIDGQKKAHDHAWWLQKFTPRGPRSIWSKVNKDKVAQLIAAGRMKSAGLAAIETAKQNGNWEAAYDSPKNATVPPDFQSELDRNAKARAFFATINGTNRYAILWRIQTAKKPETRAKRIQLLVGMLERNELLHP
jgi:uncharacterized protein YdeI (YjbR/CyaY-like superfamily)